MNGAPPHDLALEAAVLGAALLAPAAAIPALVAEEGLRPVDFYHERHERTFAAITRLHAESEPVDVFTVEHALQRAGHDVPEGFLGGLVSGVPSVGSVRAYAARVRELAVLRQKRAGALTILEGVEAEDRARIADGEALVQSEAARRKASFTPDDLATLVFDYFAQDAPETFPWPFDALNRLTAGGMRRGQLTLLGGWTSHGKSVLLDQILAHVAEKRGARVGLYINEMSVEERAVRWAARESGMDYGRALRGKPGLRDGDAASLMAALGRGFPFAVTDSAELGGSVEATIAHARANSWDVVGVDILHLFDHDEERDLARISRLLKRLAVQGKCHVIVTAHLNEKRVVGAVRPAPTLGDIRGSGMLKNDADNVLFVYREQEHDGTELLPESRIYFAKARAGVVSGMAATYEGRRMRFLADSAVEG